ncbi:hypothetical protein DOM22_11720 [Bdellovibrio sp. ZAP7]|uniref:hypothetical protein n=1 Tax=Bdellovibrio sp. ZAP7 TaxID=2231053 RepID=UPI00115A4C4A|nr:hypothetical protein [Bdellovibrio sp. ZAP7]QDK45767.1 hypothetical protein DOM22_11720 [Bdellovibrio sp. ZAP7]
MATLSKILKSVLGFVLLVAIVWVVLANYSVIFSKTVVGEVINVERVELPVALIARAGGELNEKVFSFAISIKDDTTNELFAATSEDRQWAIVQKGQCAEAVYLPYPPWELKKRGTYFGARLVKLYECPKK